jgi:choline dehydrogenase-like flavoprotein
MAMLALFLSQRLKQDNNVLFHAMVEAGVQAGYPRTDDLNGYQQEGFGPMDRTVTQKVVAQVLHVVIWIWQKVVRI